MHGIAMRLDFWGRWGERVCAEDKKIPKKEQKDSFILVSSILCTLVQLKANNRYPYSFGFSPVLHSTQVKPAH